MFTPPMVRPGGSLRISPKSLGKWQFSAILDSQTLFFFRDKNCGLVISTKLLVWQVFPGIRGLQSGKFGGDSPDPSTWAKNSPAIRRSFVARIPGQSSIRRNIVSIASCKEKGPKTSYTVNGVKFDPYYSRMITLFLRPLIGVKKLHL